MYQVQDLFRLSVFFIAEWRWVEATPKWLYLTPSLLSACLIFNSTTKHRWLIHFFWLRRGYSGALLLTMDEHHFSHPNQKYYRSSDARTYQIKILFFCYLLRFHYIAECHRNQTTKYLLPISVNYCVDFPFLLNQCLAKCYLKFQMLSSRPLIYSFFRLLSGPRLTKYFQGICFLHVLACVAKQIIRHIFWIFMWFSLNHKI